MYLDNQSVDDKSSVHVSFPADHMNVPNVNTSSRSLGIHPLPSESGDFVPPISEVIPTPPTLPIGDQTESSIDDMTTIGPDIIPGYDKVELLARYLYNLRDQEHPLTNTQANDIVQHWNELLAYDKQPAKITVRTKEKETSGRFKVSKKTNVMPGVEATRRTFIGGHGGPAQFPDANRYMECLIDKLCAGYPSPVQSKRATVKRWTLVCQAYKRIREKVVNSAVVMNDCNLQLLEINNVTLGQWYIKKEKKNEVKMLRQEITLPTMSQTATLPLPQPLELPSTLVHNVPSVQQYQFVLPTNTAGLYNPRRRLQQHHTLSVPDATQPVTDNQPEIFTATPLNIYGQFVPKSTLCYRRKKANEAASGIVTKRYSRHTSGMTCRKCGQSRNEQTGHHQYYGSWFCETTETITYQEWLSEKKNQREIRKRKRETTPPP